MKSAIVLCSGGIDSVTTAYLAKSRTYKEIHILFFDYGQRSIDGERKCSLKCAEDLNCDFKEVNVKEISTFSPSLINVKKAHNEMSRENLKDTKKESENWYVPMRNLIFLSYALAYAEYLDITKSEKNDIFVGFKNDGKESFPDTTPDFVESVNEISKVSSKGKYKIIAPLIEKDKEDIILLGKKLGVDFVNTYSCYISGKIHCGTCLACALRKEGFRWANLEDHTKYLR